MPVIRDISLSLKTGEVVRREGFKGNSSVRPEIKSLIRELLFSVEEGHLLESAIAYETYAISEIGRRAWLPRLLPTAKEVAVAVCTIGPRLENQTSDYFKQGEPLRGMLLDGIGSAAVDSLTEEVCKVIAGEALSRGCEASSPINPGMPGLPLTEQWHLFGMVPAQEIGVSLTSSGMLVPRKSASMVIGMGAQMAKWTRGEVCTRCHLKRTCAYRISA